MRIGKLRMTAGGLPLSYLFLAGILLGIILVNLGKNILLGKSGILSEQVLYGLRSAVVEGNGLLWYVIQQRYGDILFLVLFATTNLGLAAVSGAAIWYGITAGGFLAAAMLRYGMKGVLLTIVCVFPQYLLYVPAVVLLFGWCQQVCKEIHKQSGAVKQVGFSGRLLQLAVILAVVGVGCILESYVNPLLLQRFLQVF